MAMTVKDLITFLKKQPQDLPIVYCCYSEQQLLKEDEICIAELCEPRPDGWVQNYRPDMPTKEYLRFPGN